VQSVNYCRFDFHSISSRSDFLSKRLQVEDADSGTDMHIMQANSDTLDRIDVSGGTGYANQSRSNHAILWIRSLGVFDRVDSCCFSKGPRAQKQTLIHK
jgi:hypothetical protein